MLKSTVTVVASTIVLAQLAGTAGAQGRLFTSYGEVPMDKYGHSVSSAGDVNGDGVGDLVVGVPNESSNGYRTGMVRVLSGSDGSVLHATVGPNVRDFLGFSVSGGQDVDGDGFDDVVAGAPRSDGGFAFVISGQSGQILHTLLPPVSMTDFGFAVSLGRDVDSDGLADILVSGFGWATVYSGADGTVVHSITYPVPVAFGFGLASSFVGDVNGDSLDDFVVGARSDRSGGGEKGSVYVFSGFDASILYRIDGRSQYDRFGDQVAPAGDVNADGTPDIFVGAWQNFCCRSGYSRVHSGVDGALLHHFDGERISEGFAFGSGIGDIDLDGYDDVAVGAPGAVQPNGRRGEVRLMSGRLGTVISTVRAQNPGSGSFGLAVTGLGDLDGDGRPDFAVGLPAGDNDSGVENTGAVEVFSGACVAVRHFCVGGTNSVGSRGRMAASGTTSLVDSSLALLTTDLPPGVSGLFFFGSTQMQAPFGDGFRCVGGGTTRIQSFVHANASGTIEKPLDFSASPIQAGSTWNFQLWYRDAGPTGFNLSDALEVTFCQ